MTQQPPANEALADPLPGVLLVGHGTRDPRGVDEFLATARLVAERWPQPVEPCFLELASPTIAQGLERLVGCGVQQVVVMPLLLFAAGHAKRDIPAAVLRAAEQYPGLELRQAAHLGCQEPILELSAQRFDEALAPHDVTAAVDTLLLLVGRGSYDKEAIEEVYRFAALRAERSPAAGQVEVTFAAMAEPPLSTALQQAAQSGFRRVVVQPHLLFAGELLRGVGETVASFSARHPEKHWLLTNHLGPSPLLARAVEQLISQAAVPLVIANRPEGR